MFFFCFGFQDLKHQKIKAVEEGWATDGVLGQNDQHGPTAPKLETMW